MNKQLHTQGRLVVTNSRLYSEGAVVDCICNMQVSNQPCWEEDAHRLAACWNACIGIGTEALEKMPNPFGVLLSTEFKDVVAQRDELLKRLECSTQFLEDMTSNGDNRLVVLERIKRNRAAIAKAEGGAA